ncbi:HugZ family protein [Roseococcus sp.]|uniref:HugZ family pyridoxamine 5'-phosphate oxidase n=1 Tax=Roseococcus sp. TaxID=2109646 RepID=UPI003BA8E10A
MTDDPAFQARKIIRGARSATLATQLDGQPFAGLVTPACAPDLAPLLWLSTLAEHTRQLMREPRCALLFAGAAAEANPQTAPRVTLTGIAERIEDPELKARWLARHPYAALYADFGDFALWRVKPAGAQMVGGFARAARLRVEDLRPDPAAVKAIAAAEAEIIAHVNKDHPDALAAIAQGLLGGGSGTWRLAAVDVDGLDLVLEETVLRLHFAVPAADPQAVRGELIRAAKEGRRNNTLSQ